MSQIGRDSRKGLRPLCKLLVLREAPFFLWARTPGLFFYSLSLRSDDEMYEPALVYAPPPSHRSRCYYLLPSSNKSSMHGPAASRASGASRSLPLKSDWHSEVSLLDDMGFTLSM